MNLEKIKSLICNGETDDVEYKKSISELDKLGKSICGQLNARGGYGFIGITDSGKIIGAEVTDSTKKKLTAFKNHFDPWPHIDINYVELPESNKQVISLFCQRTKNTGPFTYKGKPYLKTPSGIRPMPSEKYKNLLLENAGLSKAWEALPANDFNIHDLDHEEIIKTFKIGTKEQRIPEDEYTESTLEILTHFDLLQNETINNAAMVLFSKKMPAEYSQCFLRMGRFVDDTLDDVIDSRQFRGNTFQMLTAAVDFIRKHLPISSHYLPNQLERVDEIALPLLALREALVNAICHRDYSNRAGDISLYIFDDYLEIHNIGHLYGGLTVEQLSEKHPSRRRNERIAQVFHARKLIDRFGGGTRRILRLCTEYGLPAPTFSEDSDGFSIKFNFKTPIGQRRLTQSQKAPLTERQGEIIAALKKFGPLSTKDLHKKLSSPPSERWLRNELNKLKEHGVIAVEGATVSRKWLLKI